VANPPLAGQRFTILPQKYTFGIFLHKATKTESDVDEAFQVAIRTLFREEMDKALGTF
jgi:hypothetical protein